MKSSGIKRQFKSGAVRDSAKGKPRLDLIPYECLDRVGIWYGLGAIKYGDNNWRKGQTSSQVFASMMRHASKYAQGMRDEDHLSAIVWNAFALMFNEIHYKDDPEIHDIEYWYKNGKPNKEVLK